MEDNSGNMGRAIKHLSIAASAGCFDAMHGLTTYFKKGLVSRFEIDSILTAYNNSCAEMRSKDRDRLYPYHNWNKMNDWCRLKDITNKASLVSRG